MIYYALQPSLIDSHSQSGLNEKMRLEKININGLVVAWNGNENEGIYGWTIGGDGRYMVIKVIRLLLEDLTGSARFRALWSASTSRSSVN